MCTGDFNFGSLFSAGGGLSENSPAGTASGGLGGLFDKIGAKVDSTSTGQWLKMGGQALQGLSSVDAGGANAATLAGDAASERAAATRQASLILKSAERTRGAARAATAASGARVDEFSLMNEGEIMQAGEVDASIAILTGERRARSLEQQASQQKQGGGMAALTSLFSIGSTLMGGWK